MGKKDKDNLMPQFVWTPTENSLLLSSGEWSGKSAWSFRINQLKLFKSENLDSC